MKAIWNNEIIAESDATIVIENNHYFPPDAVNDMYLKKVTPILLVLGKVKLPTIH